jgi:uncharacterized protein (TIGR02118 family)
MAQVLVLYNTPADPAAVDHYYHQTHIPLAYKIPGLRSSVISNGPVQALAGIAPHLVAILHFDSLADLNASLGSPEGQTAAADLSNFASAGATLLIYDSKAVRMNQMHTRDFARQKAKELASVIAEVNSSGMYRMATRDSH